MIIPNVETRIAIVGAGATGSLIGALLSRTGEDVTLIAREAHVEAIRQHGLQVDGIMGKLTVQVKAAETLNFKPDLILLTVKSQDVVKTCQGIVPYAHEVTLVAFQNGIRGEELASSVLGKDNILGGVVLFNASFLNPGEIVVTARGGLVIGEAFGINGERARVAASVLNRVLPTVVHNNIAGAHWTKLLINVMGNGLTSLTNQNLQSCMRYPFMRKLGVLILKESLVAIDKAGVKLGALSGFPLGVIRGVIQSPLPLAELGLRLLSRKGAKAIFSTQQSLLKDQPTEIDYLNGEIVRLGRELGLPVPINTRVTELVHEIERTRQFYRPEALVPFFPMVPK